MSRRRPKGGPRDKRRGFQTFHPLLDLIFENHPSNFHAGEVAVRPPRAPTGVDWMPAAPVPREPLLLADGDRRESNGLGRRV
jgi:hypothetical protein